MRHDLAEAIERLAAAIALGLQLQDDLVAQVVGQVDYLDDALASMR
jgi:hypothetical protein